MAFSICSCVLLFIYNGSHKRIFGEIHFPCTRCALAVCGAAALSSVSFASIIRSHRKNKIIKMKIRSTIQLPASQHTPASTPMLPVADAVAQIHEQHTHTHTVYALGSAHAHCEPSSVYCILCWHVVLYVERTKERTNAVCGVRCWVVGCHFVFRVVYFALHP